MKKILLSLFLVASLGYFNQTQAQCSGATITNVVFAPAGGSQVFYSFTYQGQNGNASIQVRFLCNGTQVGTLACIGNLKDAGTGPHTVSGFFPTSCVGTIRMEIIVWTNNSCGGNDCLAAFREISNSPLPVSLKSFTAARNRSNVVVKWETATEINNSGFAVERNINGSWEQVAFVASQAVNGNSDAILSYQYIDLNNTKGITQYRIKQVDIDLKSKYSEVRAVRGEGQLGKTVVYPNPTNDGKVNIVFEDGNVSRDISVSDMSGRTIKQLRGITNNNITIENLTPGMYSLRIVIPSTGEQSVEKIVVNKR